MASLVQGHSDEDCHHDDGGDGKSGHNNATVGRPFFFFLSLDDLVAVNLKYVCVWSDDIVWNHLPHHFGKEAGVNGTKGMLEDDELKSYMTNDGNDTDGPGQRQYF